MARLDELWRCVDGPGTPPCLDSRRVKAQVNAALDADQTERKMYMKQKLRMALVAAAAIAALTGSAFAATTGWSGLSDWFKGDTTLGREYVHDMVQSVSDKDYSMTVEGIAADEYSAYMTITITALSDEAKEFIHDEYFNSIDLLYIWLDFKEPVGEEKSFPCGCTYYELEAPDKNSRRFAAAVRDIPYSAAAVRVHCGYMEKGKQVVLPIAPAPSVTLKIGASGAGVMSLGPDTLPEPEDITIDEITLSPFTCHIKGDAIFGIDPNICLRMADGTIRTQSQMMEPSSSGSGEFYYRFKEIQSLDGTGIVSVIVFDKEYPLDGSKPAPVEHNPALDPFTVTRMERLGEGRGYTVPVRELTEKLGGVCTWDPSTGDVSCVYRDVTIVLHSGKDTALVNGEAVGLPDAPAERNGILAADWSVFKEAWGISGFVQHERIRSEEDPTDVEIIWHDWYIIP